MISIDEWKLMSGNSQTMWLERNKPAILIGAPRGVIRGVCVNDAPYCTKPTIDGFQVWCPAYVTWAGVIRRCYSAKYHAKKANIRRGHHLR